MTYLDWLESQLEEAIDVFIEEKSTKSMIFYSQKIMMIEEVIEEAKTTHGDIRNYALAHFDDADERNYFLFNRMILTLLYNIEIGNHV